MRELCPGEAFRGKASFCCSPMRSSKKELYVEPHSHSFKVSSKTKRKRQSELHLSRSPTCSPPPPPQSTGTDDNLKYSNVLVFVKLIFGLHWPNNHPNKKPNISKLGFSTGSANQSSSFHGRLSLSRSVFVRLR